MCNLYYNVDYTENGSLLKLPTYIMKETMDNKENPTFTFTLDLNEANAILAALQELPAKIANPITESIRKQAQEQLAAMQSSVEKVAAEPVAE